MLPSRLLIKLLCIETTVHLLGGRGEQNLIVEENHIYRVWHGEAWWKDSFLQIYSTENLTWKNFKSISHLLYIALSFRNITNTSLIYSHRRRRHATSPGQLQEVETDSKFGIWSISKNSDEDLQDDIHSSVDLYLSTLIKVINGAVSNLKGKAKDINCLRKQVQPQQKGLIIWAGSSLQVYIEKYTMSLNS